MALVDFEYKLPGRSTYGHLFAFNWLTGEEKDFIL